MNNKTWTITSTGLIHSNMLVKAISGLLKLDRKYKSTAEKLYWGVATVPSLPGGVILDLIEGKRLFIEDGDKVHILARGQMKSEFLAEREKEPEWQEGDPVWVNNRGSFAAKIVCFTNDVVTVRDTSDGIEYEVGFNEIWEREEDEDD